jgi:hypothetical protein
LLIFFSLQDLVELNEAALEAAERAGRGYLYNYDMDWLRTHYPDDPFFELGPQKPVEEADFGGTDGDGEPGTGRGPYPYLPDFRAWATQFNEVSIHHALAVRDLEGLLLSLPGLRVDRNATEPLHLNTGNQVYIF